jgi:ammonia channel protein AmtB
MKILYTILFFLDTTLLVFLAYWFLRTLDAGTTPLSLIAMASAIIACIGFLVYLFVGYLKLPPKENKH